MIRSMLFILILPIGLCAQNTPPCDSVNIDCCSFELSDNTLTLMADNQSSYLFPYPGFIILDDETDTIAKETVNYFGIGPFPQMHVLEIIKTPQLPFTGNLELHSLFYDTLNCVFEITIPDTTLTSAIPQLSDHIWVYPNPCNDDLWIDWGEPANAPIKMEIINLNGQLVKKVKTSFSETSPITMGLSDLETGLYFLQIETNEKVFSRKLVKQ